MNEWVTEKPDFKEECLVIAATALHRGWFDYSLFQVKNIETEEGWYIGLLNGQGEEWGDIEDFVADKYFVMPLLK